MTEYFGQQLVDVHLLNKCRGMIKFDHKSLSYSKTLILKSFGLTTIKLVCGYFRVTIHL